MIAKVNFASLKTASLSVIYKENNIDGNMYNLKISAGLKGGNGNGNRLRVRM